MSDPTPFVLTDPQRPSDLGDTTINSSLNVVVVVNQPAAGDPSPVAQSLSANGDRHEVIQVGDLEAAMQVAGEGPDDVLLLDLSSGNGDTLTSLRRLLQEKPHLPVVVFSDGNDRAFALRALQLGAQDCLSSDHLDSHVLERSLRHAVERQRIVAELRRTHDRQRHLATHDLLTGLPNRQLYLDRLALSLALGHRYQEVVGVLFLDLDDFKSINDSFGHAAGDRVLRYCADRFTTCIRSSDTVARFGGDEFTFILSRIADTSDITAVVAKIFRSFSEPLRVNGSDVWVSGSLGLAEYPRDGESPEALLQQADRSMYVSKLRRRERLLSRSGSIQSFGELQS